ncbi:hypothetical protein B0J13DRAFT_581780 [Dactylonectria estremocensis]|uniref:Aminoglycoside phosphotransferase domain-containing protein n=1 Tax=Dactylonectria estremocensis TaxID=1079267 RepID=A0A9P9JB93_9HYPO|nr:hypothetical protein B0J13DRAFT_581780 [Dactylonectria estremocensis]
MDQAILKTEVEREIERFVESINTNAICRLASSYHGGVPCQKSRVPKHGCFNVCIFVVFNTSPPDRWVVRIALPALAAWIDERIETQLANMKYVSAKITIPVPRVHGYSFTDDSPIDSAFIIIDYIHGYTLDEFSLPFKTDSRTRCFINLAWARHKYRKQVADFYIQFRQDEFPKIGALGLPINLMNGQPSFDCDPSRIHVVHCPMPMVMAAQESFVEDAILSLARNDFDKSLNIGLNARGGRDTLYAQHHFRRFVLDNWLDSDKDKAPFFLVHGGLSMLLDKLVFDAKLNLVGVLDWAWSCVIPAQMMVPPAWEMSSLVAAITEREYVLGLPPRLSQEWVKMETWCHSAIVMAVTRLDLIHETYWFFLFNETEGKIPWGVDFRCFYKWAIIPRLVAFMELPERRALLARRVEEQRQFFKDEKEHFQMESARRILEESGEAT